MPEEGWGCAVRRPSCKTVLSFAVVLSVLLGVPAFFCWQRHAQQQPQLAPVGWHVAELQLDLTGTGLDSLLRWKAGADMGRSFLQGPELVDGQLRINCSGIYRLHIQVTLANCSTVPPRATLTVGICSPATQRISLLRLNFHQGCTVTSQRLTRLVTGDTLCVNLTLPLLPSRNADETFFGVQYVSS